MLVILQNDHAVGYHDMYGTEIVGTVACTSNYKSEGRKIAKTGDTVVFPPHQKTINDYSGTTISVTGIGKMKISGSSVILGGQVLSNGAVLVASGVKLKSV